MRFLPAALAAVLLSACSVFGFARECTPTLQQSIPYTFTIGDQTTDSTATIGAAQRGEETFVHLRDAGGYQTAIRIEIVAPLAVGAVSIPDPTASYPPEFVPPITVRGADPNGDEGGLFFGGLTITDLTPTTVSGRFEFRLARPNIEPVFLTGTFTGVEIQNCGVS